MKAMEGSFSLSYQCMARPTGAGARSLLGGGFNLGPQAKKKGGGQPLDQQPLGQ